MALSMTACGGGKAAETTAAPAETKAEETKAEESKAEEASKEETAEKAPEDYTGSVVVYSPHEMCIRDREQAAPAETAAPQPSQSQVVGPGAASQPSENSSGGPGAAPAPAAEGPGEQ